MHLNPQDNTLQRSSTSTLSEVIYQVMSLNYGKLHLEILVKLILAKVTFLDVDQKHCVWMGEKSILG